MANPAYHMVHYRRALLDPATSGDKTLESACRGALDRRDVAGIDLWQRATDRICKVDGNPNNQIILNRVADLSSAIFGEMCLIEDRGMQALLALTASKTKLSSLTLAEVFKLSESTAPTGTHFVRGMVYWLAIGDNLLFVRTQAMTSEHLRKYLEWLLSAAGEQLPPNPLKLQAEFNRASVTGGAGGLGDVRRFSIGGHLGSRIGVECIPDDTAAAPKDGKRSRARRVLRKLTESVKTNPILIAALGEPDAQSLIASLGPDEYVSVTTEISVHGRRTEQSRKALKELVSSLADMTDSSIHVEGKDGRLSDNDAVLRTSMPFHVAEAGRSLLDFDNVADQLQEVYRRFTKDGLIRAT